MLDGNVVIFRQYGLAEAVVTVKKKRDVKPNEGFLQQPIEYQDRLDRGRE